MTATWVYPPTGPFQVRGRDLSEDNFAHEDRSSLEILIREVLQNPLDARAPDNSGAVRVRIGILQPDSFDHAFLNRLLDDEYRSRLEASGGDPLPDPASAPVMVLEDFGTTGLQGTWDDQNVEGPEENWNAFWFLEGEGAKPETSNGRAGQGKITYYRVSAARAVFGYTIRKSDGIRLLMGRSAFRRVYPYPEDGPRYLRHSFWCTGTEQALPVTSEAEITAFRAAFQLNRVDEPGLSLVIPMPNGFELRQALQTVVTDFYFPIACGNLEVDIGKACITAANIDDLAGHILTDDEAHAMRSSFTRGFRKLVRKAIAADRSGSAPVEVKPGWERKPLIPEDAFPKGALEGLRAAMDAGERIWVRFPVTVHRKRGGPVRTWFDVHLEIPEDLDRCEEAYIRRDLLIGSEGNLSGKSHLQKARALILIRDAPLSAFLADAEEPTHLRWNASRPRLSEDYTSPQTTLRAVRNAASRLLAVVSNGQMKSDMKALAKYFARPAEDGKTRTGEGRKRDGTDTDEPNDPPAPVRKPFRIKTGIDRIEVHPNGGAAPAASELPVACSLEIAYEGLDQDPFKAYDPFDFDLADPAAHAISGSGVTISERQGNRIRFDVTDAAFKLEVPGFDPNIRLRARLTYKEGSNGASVSEE